jgi:hypothetical protein
VKDGICIPAGVVRLCTFLAMVLLGIVVARELPEVRRYLRSERM